MDHVNLRIRKDPIRVFIEGKQAYIHRVQFLVRTGNDRYLPTEAGLIQTADDPLQECLNQAQVENVKSCMT